MASDGLHIARSPLEEERFGVPTARAEGLTAGNLDEALAFGRDHGVSLLIARAAATDPGNQAKRAEFEMVMRIREEFGL